MPQLRFTLRVQRENGKPLKHPREMHGTYFETHNHSTFAWLAAEVPAARPLHNCTIALHPNGVSVMGFERDGESYGYQEWWLVPETEGVPASEEAAVSSPGRYEWTADMALGVTAVDTGHRMLLDQATRLADLVSADDRLAIRSLLADMVEEAVYNFAREEGLLDYAGFPAINAHRSRHELFLDKLREVRARLANEPEAVDLDDLLVTLDSWVSDHVKGADREWMPYARPATADDTRPAGDVEAADSDGWLDEESGVASVLDGADGVSEPPDEELAHLFEDADDDQDDVLDIDLRAMLGRDPTEEDAPEDSAADWDDLLLDADGEAEDPGEAPPPDAPGPSGDSDVELTADSEPDAGVEPEVVDDQTLEPAADADEEVLLALEDDSLLEMDTDATWPDAESLPDETTDADPDPDLGSDAERHVPDVEAVEPSAGDDSDPEPALPPFDPRHPEAADGALVWREEMSVGVPELDDDHRRMLDMTERLRRERGDPDPEARRAAVGDVLDFLVDYTEHHFDREARVMAAVDYEHREAHLKIHRELQEVVHELKVQYGGAPDSVDLDLVYEFLRTWLVQHILKEDLAFASLVADSPVALAAAAVAGDGDLLDDLAAAGAEALDEVAMTEAGGAPEFRIPNDDLDGPSLDGLNGDLDGLSVGGLDDDLVTVGGGDDGIADLDVAEPESLPFDVAADVTGEAAELPPFEVEPEDFADPPGEPADPVGVEALDRLADVESLMENIRELVRRTEEIGGRHK